METTIIALTDAYQLVGPIGAWLVITVRNKEGAEFYIGDTPGTNKGHILQKLDGMTPTSWVDGNIYARKRLNTPEDVEVAITA